MLKKFFAALICMLAVLGGAVLASATTDKNAVINYVDMREMVVNVEDEYGENTDESYVAVAVNFNLTNNCGSDMEFAPFVAFYSGTQFVDAVRAETQEIATDDTAEFSVTSEIAYTKNADTCKVFVFDNNLVPYTSVVEGEFDDYDENGATSENYAYIIRARAGSDGWNNIVMVQLLDKSGEVYTAYLADEINIKNASADVKTAAGMTETDETVNSADIDHEAFAELLANQLVTYEANGVGELSAITFAKTGVTSTLSLYAAGVASFNETDREATINGTKVTIADDTAVFFIKGSNTISAIGDTENLANISYSKVATGADVNNITTYAAAYDVIDDVAKVLVVLNATLE